MLLEITKNTKADSYFCLYTVVFAHSCVFSVQIEKALSFFSNAYLHSSLPTLPARGYHHLPQYCCRHLKRCYVWLLCQVGCAYKKFVFCASFCQCIFLLNTRTSLFFVDFLLTFPFRFKRNWWDVVTKPPNPSFLNIYPSKEQVRHISH